MTLIPPELFRKQQQEEQKRREQRIQMALRKQPDTTVSVAKDSVTYQKGHMQSMSEALREVKKSKHKIPDGLNIRPENH